MTLEKILLQAIHLLNKNSIEDAHIEAGMLLRHVLNISAAELYTEPERYLSAALEGKYQKLIQRRILGEPSAYILHRKEFYGIDFYVDNRVLIPRPETELLVEETLKILHDEVIGLLFLRRNLSIADIGTGCGNIAISLALNYSRANIFAVDISSEAADVARLNCEHYEVTDRITLLQGNLLEPVVDIVDIIVANLPYIESTHLAKLSPEVYCFEPKLALDGGEKGLSVIDQFLKQIKETIDRQCNILFEIGLGQQEQVADLISKYLHYAEFEFIPDLNMIPRVAKVKYQKRQHSPTVLTSQNNKG